MVLSLCWELGMMSVSRILAPIPTCMFVWMSTHALIHTFCFRTHNYDVRRYQECPKCIERSEYQTSVRLHVLWVVGKSYNWFPVLSLILLKFCICMSSVSFVCVSILLYVSSFPAAFLFMELDKVTPMLRDLTKDHLRMLDALKASDRDWIAVCPPHIAGKQTSFLKYNFYFSSYLRVLHVKPLSRIFSLCSLSTL